jgi:heptosyltransferase-3
MIDPKIAKIKKGLRRVLFIYWGLLGDMVVALPLMEALGRILPKVKIDYLLLKSKDGLRDNAELLLKYHPRVRRCYLYDPSCVLGLIFSKPYDLVIDLCGASSTQAVARLSARRFMMWGDFRRAPTHFSYSFRGKNSWSLSCERKLAQNYYTSKGKAFRTDQFMEVARFLGGGPAVRSYPKLYLSRDERDWQEGYFKKLKIAKDECVVGFQPGGCLRPRLWPIGRYAALMKRLDSYGRARILVFLGPGEQDIRRQLSRRIKGRLIFAQEKNLRRYMALLAGCRAFVTSDGGPLHIALALGVPSVGIFRNDKHAYYWFDAGRRPALFPVLLERCKKEAQHETAWRALSSALGKDGS